MRLFLFMLLLFSSSYAYGQQTTQDNMKLIYVYDALCGWCYGFSPVITEFHQNHEEELDFEVLSGGMITGSRIGPIGEVAGYISKAYKDVERATGVTFGQSFLEDILEEGSAVFTSIPPAIALTVFKQHQPGQAVAFAARLQKAIYYDGIEPVDYEAYGELAAEFGLEPSSFVAEMKQNENLQRAREEFRRASGFGVTGFPTVLLQHNGQTTVLARGYMPLPRLEAAYQQAME
ncbi:MAG: DsbA family protein [bacterium]|nr:DsbA family protein [Phaeodactylibacter xiamenensis]MCR9055023.1 DsbA family protein [bacterium]